MAQKANTYPVSKENPTITHSDGNRPNLGLCFSGGGSRAMTCAWGQILGLETLGLMDKPRYISSVSGGTWASSVYTFLPKDISDEDLLGKYYPPGKLSLEKKTGCLDVNHMPAHRMGKASDGMAFGGLVAYTLLFLAVHRESNYKWLWANIVARFILSHYGLRAKGKEPWTSSKYFSLSSEYAAKHFPKEAPPLDDFFFLRPGRPFIIMNNNMMEKVSIPGTKSFNIVQLPSQVTPVSGGAMGETPGGGIKGDGSVESYAVASVLDQASSDVSPVDVTISQPYSLIDIVSTSSAFFAEVVAKWVLSELKDAKKRAALIKEVEAIMKPEHKESLLKQAKKDVKDLRDIRKLIEEEVEGLLAKHVDLHGGVVPTYNHWPIARDSRNRETEFTDGGSLENTGILGLLAQTDTRGSDPEPLSIVAFVNTDIPLEKKSGSKEAAGKDGSNGAGRIIAGDQAAALFGIDFNSKEGTHKAFTDEQRNPRSKSFNPHSLVHVFTNEGPEGATPFDLLVKGLYATSCGAAPGTEPDDRKVNTEAPYHQMELTTVDNPLAGVTGGRKVRMLYVQNAKMLHWQDKLEDTKLAQEIIKGQEGGKDPFAYFRDFPCFNTETKIRLHPKESNCISQMWAWAVSDDDSPLKKQVEAFFDSAGN